MHADTYPGASGRLPKQVRGLDRTIVTRLVVNEDGSPRVELVLHLADFRGERNLLYPIVGPLTRDERFDDPAQRVRTEQAVRYDHDCAVSMLSPGLPETITIDGSEANAAAIKSYNETHGTAIVIRQVKYLHNVVEQDHRAVKRVTRPMLRFKSFEAAQSTLVGIELMHMLRKGQLEGGVKQDLSVAEQFYALDA